ncbi:50S ribosomal protein L34 isoform X2 [Tasmannia lanceolata]|uniref:50S ribosomal protein L34 isoform X2 n=1 Tax=Tasmannia lanceolata TaxID=3420 RepID=UPI004063F2AC
MIMACLGIRSPLVACSDCIRKHSSVVYRSLSIGIPFSHKSSRFPLATRVFSMEAEQKEKAGGSCENPLMNLLFVEMGVGYDQHGQDITAAAMRACRDAISSNSIPAFRREWSALLRSFDLLWVMEGEIKEVILNWQCAFTIAWENLYGNPYHSLSFDTERNNRVFSDKSKHWRHVILKIKLSII